MFSIVAIRAHAQQLHKPDTVAIQYSAVIKGSVQPLQKGYYVNYWIDQSNTAPALDILINIVKEGYYPPIPYSEIKGVFLDEKKVRVSYPVVICLPSN